MGEIDRLELRMTGQNVSHVMERAGVKRTMIYRLYKTRNGNISTLDAINKALDEMGVKRVSDKRLIERITNGREPERPEA